MGSPPVVYRDMMSLGGKLRGRSKNVLDHRQPGWGGRCRHVLLFPSLFLHKCVAGVRGDAAPGVAPEPRVFISLLEPHEAASDGPHTLLGL